MCMTNCVEETRKFLKKHKNHKTCTVYKVVQQECFIEKPYYYDENGKWHNSVLAKTGNLVGPFQAGYKYSVGWNKSGSRAKLATKNKDIEKGIHVCLTWEEAKYIGGLNVSSKIIKVKVNIEDLIGVNANSERAVFKQIFISQKEFDEALKD
jgi:hypothetical protein